MTAPPLDDPRLAGGREQLAAAEAAMRSIMRISEGNENPVREVFGPVLAEYDRRGELIAASPGGLMMRTSIAQFEASLAKVESDTTTAMLDETAAALERAESDLAHARDRIAALEAECERREREDRIRIVGGYLPAVMTVPEVRRYLGVEVDGG